MKLGKDEEHNKAVFLWFKQKREGEMNDDEVDQLMTSLVPHSVAVKMFDECLKWLEEQEVSTYNTAILRDLRELAARKRLSGLNQTRIRNFFQAVMYTVNSYDK